jgi:DNA-directed RNA polymerase specialized sigma24 family protein
MATYKIRPWLTGLFSIFELNFSNPTPTRKKVAPSVRLGIDLENRMGEVRKLFMKHCAPMCIRAKCDPEEVLQEVYKGIIIRNNGECPFDPRKSAFSTYVVMVATCVSTNYVNKNSKTISREYYGSQETPALEEDHILKSQSACASGLDDAEFSMTISHIKSKIDSTARVVLDDLLDGYKVSTISKNRGIDSRRMSKYMDQIKSLLSEGKTGC